MSMNGAQALMRTLVEAGIEVCFSNPGTSEMHFVAALDDEPKMRAVLALFEGVATGAADGYARMADKPAAVLLHLGVGIGNGMANLHNARKGKVPVINIVGDHATYHVQYNAQLQSDIETVARNVSPEFVRTSQTTAALCKDTVEAITAAITLPHKVATLILPADVSWGEGGKPEAMPELAPAPIASDDTITEIAQAINKGKKVAMLLGGHALREPSLIAAAKIAAKTGVKLLHETFPTRHERGAGLPVVEKLAYFAELVGVQLADIDHLILVDTKAPVSFFAYPGKKSYLVPDKCQVHTLASEEQNALASLEKLVKAVEAEQAIPVLQAAGRPDAPSGSLTAEKVCQALGHQLPDNAIIIDEAITSGLMLPKMTEGSPRHDYLSLTGGGIGQGTPNAVGAAIACPDRPVFALIGEGTSMYTIQSLWTMAREGLDVTVIIFNNASYSVLNIELERVGASKIGKKARSQLDLNGPVINFSKLAESMGVHGTRVSTADEMNHALAFAIANKGPHLIEAIVPEAVSGLKRKVLPTVMKAIPKLPLPITRALKKKIAP